MESIPDEEGTEDEDDPKIQYEDGPCKPDKGADMTF